MIAPPTNPERGRSSFALNVETTVFRATPFAAALTAPKPIQLLRSYLTNDTLNLVLHVE